MKKACKKMSQLASDRLERNLSLRELFEMSLHLVMCGACRAYNRNLEKLHEVLGMRLEMINSDVVLSEKQKIKIRQEIQKASGEN